MAVNPAKNKDDVNARPNLVVWLLMPGSVDFKLAFLLRNQEPCGRDYRVCIGPFI
jgi:hypothetical protein